MAKSPLVIGLVGLIVGIICFIIAHSMTVTEVKALKAETVADATIDNTLAILILNFLPIFVLIAVLSGTAVLIYKAST